MSSFGNAMNVASQFANMDLGKKADERANKQLGINTFFAKKARSDYHNRFTIATKNLEEAGLSKTLATGGSPSAPISNVGSGSPGSAGGGSAPSQDGQMVMAMLKQVEDIARSKEQKKLLKAQVKGQDIQNTRMERDAVIDEIRGNKSTEKSTIITKFASEVGAMMADMVENMGSLNPFKKYYRKKK